MQVRFMVVDGREPGAIKAASPEAQTGGETDAGYGTTIVQSTLREKAKIFPAPIVKTQILLWRWF
jgi:hypothetical protein